MKEYIIRANGRYFESVKGTKKEALERAKFASEFGFKGFTWVEHKNGNMVEETYFKHGKENTAEDLRIEARVAILFCKQIATGKFKPATRTTSEAFEGWNENARLALVTLDMTKRNDQAFTSYQWQIYADGLRYVVDNMPTKVKVKAKRKGAC